MFEHIWKQNSGKKVGGHAGEVKHAPQPTLSLQGGLIRSRQMLLCTECRIHKQTEEASSRSNNLGIHYVQLDYTLGSPQGIWII